MAVEPSVGSLSASSPASRDKSLGNGKHCHQCRQNRDFLAACKKQRNNRPCGIKICSKCLLNRYGEKVDEVATLKEWSCPKCRGICNCSVCMKRRGHQPTGILVKTAKATGFSSVSDMLLKSAERRTNHENVGAYMNASLQKESVISPTKRGKENSFDGKLDINLPKSVEMNSKNAVGMPNGKADDTTSSKKPKKMKRDQLGETSNSEVDKENGLHVNEKKRKKSRKEGLNENADGLNLQAAEGPLPVGIDLKNVVGITIHPKDVGNALQFLEFSSVFGKILDLKKGEAEYIIEDLLQGRSARRDKFCLTVQFHMRILSMILTDRGENSTLRPSYGKNSWFNSLKKCLAESERILKEPGLDSLEKAADYDTLNASEKLRVLNLLCDEVLGTAKIRNWIDHQYSQSLKKAKVAKQKLRDAKGKEKSLKQKMKDDAKAIVANGDAHPSIPEQEAFVARRRSEAAEAHAQLLEPKGMLLKSYQTCDAVRIEPIFVDHRDRVYWKLNCYGETDVLYQNIGKGDDTLTSDERWFTLDAGGKEMIENHISSLRRM